MLQFIKRRLQIFVSSTYKDLQDERQVAVKAILKAGNIPAGMELFTSGDKSQWEVIEKWIQDSDVYLLILGGRYGSIEQASGKSYTHLEYEYALKIGKPLFACVIQDNHLELKIKNGSKYENIREVENKKDFDNFKSLVMSKPVSLCENLDQIQSEILLKMIELERDNSLTGWIRASDSIDSKLLTEELARLSRENNELRKNLLQERTIQGISYSKVEEVFKNIVLEETIREEAKLRIFGVERTNAINPNLLNAVNEVDSEIIKYNVQNILDYFKVFAGVFLKTSNDPLNILKISYLLDIIKDRKFDIILHLKIFKVSRITIFNTDIVSDEGEDFLRYILLKNIAGN
jgi:Domain of unknown function (DUF4062)